MCIGEKQEYPGFSTTHGFRASTGSWKLLPWVGEDCSITITTTVATTTFPPHPLPYGRVLHEWCLRATARRVLQNWLGFRLRSRGSCCRGRADSEGMGNRYYLNVFCRRTEREEPPQTDRSSEGNSPCDPGDSRLRGCSDVFRTSVYGFQCPHEGMV